MMAGVLDLMSSMHPFFGLLNSKPMDLLARLIEEPSIPPKDLAMLISVLCLVRMAREQDAPPHIRKSAEALELLATDCYVDLTADEKELTDHLVEMFFDGCQTCEKGTCDGIQIREVER